MMLMVWMLLVLAVEVADVMVAWMPLVLIVVVVLRMPLVVLVVLVAVTRIIGKKKASPRE